MLQGQGQRGREPREELSGVQRARSSLRCQGLRGPAQGSRALDPLLQQQSQGQGLWTGHHRIPVVPGGEEEEEEQEEGADRQEVSSSTLDIRQSRGTPTRLYT